MKTYEMTTDNTEKDSTGKMMVNSGPHICGGV